MFQHMPYCLAAKMRIGRPAALAVLIVFVVVLLSRSSPQETHAADEYVLDDGGIQRIYLDNVPQLNRRGGVQYTYDADSFFPLLVYFPDMGDMGDAKRRFNLDRDHTRGSLPQIKAAGFNTVWTSWWPPTGDELTYIQNVGLRVVANLQAVIYESVKKDNWSFLTEEVNRLKSDPSVLAYHLFDEDPTNPGPFAPDVDIDQAGWLAAYNTIRQADPTHAIYPINVASPHACTYIPLGSHTATYDFRPYSDIWMTDAYGIFEWTTDLELTANRHDASIQSCEASGGAAKPYMYLAQAYRENDDRVRPSPQLVRAYMYSAIVHGATGLGYFPFHSAWIFGGESRPDILWYSDGPTWGGLGPEVSPDLWAAVGKMNREIETNKRIILSKTSSDEYHIYVKRGTATATHPIHTILKNPDGGSTRYLLAVNIDSQAVPSKFNFNRQISSVTSVFDNRQVAYSGNEFSETLEGFGVRLYKIDYSEGGGLPRPPQTTLPYVRPVTTSMPGTVNGDAWSLRNSASAGEPDLKFSYGRTGDIPLPGDWNGDGIRTAGAVRNTAGSLTWYLSHRNASGGPNITVNYGRAGDVPLAGDWDGDSRDSIGVFRDGSWLLTNDFGQSLFAVGFGQAGDLPVVGDWDGDGKDDIGVFRRGSWILTTDGGVTQIAVGFGQADDVPVVGDWNGDGKDDIGVFRQGAWILTTDRGQSGFSFAFGNPTDMPITGHWTNP
jgi:hypothetical protein